jgi:beta-lactamase class D
MKAHPLLIVLVTLVTSPSCSSQKAPGIDTLSRVKDSVEVHSGFQRYFDSCKVTGAIAIYDQQRQQWVVSDSEAVKKETLPASTFKVINLLIALETKVIKDENEVVKWPGSTDTVKYGYRPDIYRDMTVKEAFEVSAGWVFIELAKRIGRSNYQQYLTLATYGNVNLSQPDADCWNFGAFAISPMNQVSFLKNLYNERLPFSKRNMAIVKRVMITEHNTNYTIRSKTGWTREGGINTGWWVGYWEKDSNVYFFATCLLQDRSLNNSNFGNCRKSITMAALRDLGVIK